MGDTIATIRFGSGGMPQEPVLIRATATENYGSTAGGDLAFYTRSNGSSVAAPPLDRFHITHDGRIGIGNPNPPGNVAFDVKTQNGGVRFGNTLSGSSGGTPISDVTTFVAVPSNCTPASVSAGSTFTCSLSSPYTPPAGATHTDVSCSMSSPVVATALGAISAGTLYLNAMSATGSGTSISGSVTFKCMATSFF